MYMTAIWCNVYYISLLKIEYFKSMLYAFSNTRTVISFQLRLNKSTNLTSRFLHCSVLARSFQIKSNLKYILYAKH